MSRTRKYRSLASIALLSLSEKELRELHKTMSNMSSSSFLELVRDIEDEIDGSIHLSLDNFEESSVLNISGKDLFREIDYIRRKELQITVLKFADLLSMYIKEYQDRVGQPIPNFDSRRGLQNWVDKLIRVCGEQEVYHAVMRLLNNELGKKDSDWKLR